MASQKKYRLASARNSSGSKFYWLLILIALAALAWMAWHERRKTEIHDSAAKKIAPVSNPTANPSPPAAAKTNLAARTDAIFKTPEGNYPRPVQNIFEAQLALDHLGISSGSLDGKSGPQTRAALAAFQQQEKIPATGELDAPTKSRLTLASAPFLNYLVTSNDLAGLQPVGKTWLAKSQQTALAFETLLELIAENSHAHPALIRRLNPAVNWTNEIPMGTILQIPDATRAEPAVKAAFVKISLADKILEAFDENTNLLAHFPCSIAQHVEKRPVGELHVAVVAPNPNYTFDPAIFPESPEAQQLKTKLVIPPGPNNPVGVVWIGLDKPGYGMHGTPSPEMVGRTESHGCFRLANWNAQFLLKLVWIGMPVYVEP